MKRKAVSILIIIALFIQLFEINSVVYADSDRNPIVHFDFEDENISGNKVTDVVSGIEAKFGEYSDDNNTVWTDGTIVTEAGINGKALRVKGRQDLIAPFEVLENTGNEATIQVWIRLNELGVWNTLFSAGAFKKSHNFKRDNTFFVIGLYRDDTKATAVEYKYAGEASFVQTNNVNIKSNVGQWALVTYVQNGNTGRLYINNQKIAENTNLPHKLNELYDDLKSRDESLTLADIEMNLIGASVWADDSARGLVDDIKIYDVALTDQEISAEFTSKNVDLNLRTFNPIENGRFTINSDGSVTSKQDIGSHMVFGWRLTMPSGKYMISFKSKFDGIGTAGKVDDETKCAYWEIVGVKAARFGATDIPALNGQWQQINMLFTLDSDIDYKELRFEQLHKNVGSGEFYFSISKDINVIKLSDAEYTAAEKANPIVEAINAIPASVKAADKNAVIDARNEYNKLTELEKSFVFNLSKLAAAEKALGIGGSETNPDTDAPETTHTPKTADAPIMMMVMLAGVSLFGGIKSRKNKVK